MKNFIRIICMVLMIQVHAHAQVKGKSVVVIDPLVPEKEVLVKNVEAGSKIVYMPVTQNPLTFLNSVLKAYAPVRVLHIFTEGRQGALVFSGQNVDSRYLERFIPLLGNWREYFCEGGDILLYGCEVAKGTPGVEFVQSFAVHTGLDIAASDNHTGTWRKYGDWLLEIKSGRIENRIAVNKNVVEEYLAVLSSSSTKKGK